MKKRPKKKIVVSLKIVAFADSFAENKDIARYLRESQILPALQEGKEIIFDYEGVDSTTQSFTHALISDAIRKFGSNVLDRIFFKNCNKDVKSIIRIVVEYMQGNMNSPISA
ncbi:MAG: STAS-like domain-containing protein [bacterium]|nr:STAS-like domain-containing protein [bacterium]